MYTIEVAHKTKKSIPANDRKRKSFESRYTMNRAAFRLLRKKSPQEAHEVRMKAQNRIVYKVDALYSE